MIIELYKSTQPNKKYTVKVNDKTIHFGDSRYKDFRTFGEDRYKRKENYIKRHQVNENWNKDGIETAGWWSRWLLWNKPTLEQSIRDVEKRFKISIKNKT